MGYQYFLRLAAVVALLGLTACGGGGDTGGASGGPSGLSCTSLAPLVDGPSSTANCAGTCKVDRASAAADGNFDSAAVLRMDGTAAGFVAVSAKASGGGMFAAGTTVGAIYDIGASSQQAVSYQLNTYLGGVLQDSFTIRTDGQGSLASAPSSTKNTATRPYDTVEFRYSRGSGTTSGRAGVYEFCSG